MTPSIHRDAIWTTLQIIAVAGMILQSSTTARAATVASIANGTADIANNTTSMASLTNQTDIASTKTEVQKKPNTSTLSIWGIMNGLWNWITSDLNEIYGSIDESEGRTFGKIRRLQMALIPIAFKFGIITAMITLLVALAIKTIFLLKLLLFINSAGLLVKLLSFKHSYEPSPHHSNYNGWSAAPVARHEPWISGAPATPINKEIHLHIHGSTASYPTYGAQQHHWDRNDPYTTYETHYTSGNKQAERELNKGPTTFLKEVQYPLNHRQG